MKLTAGIPNEIPYKTVSDFSYFEN